MIYDVDILNTIIQSRRSIKPGQYIAQAVDENIIYHMLENANWAPTHGLTQPWRFVVFSENGLHILSQFLGDLYKSKTHEADYNESKYQKLISTPLKASHIIYIGVKFNSNPKISETEEICAAACAVQNMQLTAEAYGVGCYWSTGAMSGSEDMKSFLGLEAADKCLGMLYVGNYAGNKPASTRNDIKERTKWVK